MDEVLVLVIPQMATARLASQAPSHSPDCSAFLVRLELLHPKLLPLLPQVAYPVPLVNIQIPLDHNPAFPAAPINAPP